jgi:alkylation response protein AidB-like acyl-CoA dehydrogenase
VVCTPAGRDRGTFDEAVRYANERTTLGRKIIDHQGLGFLLADMSAAVVSARATYLDAARRRDAGSP